MAIKESLEENKNLILESLPTQELKNDFLASLEKVQEPVPITSEEAVTQAQAPDHMTEGMYADVEKDIKSMQPVPVMTETEEKAAIEEELKNVPTAPNEAAE